MKRYGTLIIIVLLLSDFSFSQVKLCVKLTTSESIIPFRNYNCQLFIDSLNNEYFILVNKEIDKSCFSFYRNNSYVNIKVIKLQNRDSIDMAVVDYKDIYLISENVNNKIDVYKDGITYSKNAGEIINVMIDRKIIPDLYLLIEDDN